MRHRLPLFPLSCAPVLGAILASSALAREGVAPQDEQAAVARAGPASTPAPLPAAADLRAPDLAVRHLISSYGRAIEAQDVKLFRSLMPGITIDAERRLRESFRTIKSQRVGMTIDLIDIGGKTATVRVSRGDTIDGRRMKPVQQVFHLVLLDDGWRIHSLSAGR